MVTVFGSGFFVTKNEQRQAIDKIWFHLFTKYFGSYLQPASVVNKDL